MSDGARVVRIPPPLYYGVGFGLGMVMPRLAIGDVRIAGLIVLAVGVVFALSGVVTVVRHKTTIVPHHAVATLVTSGPYRLSRNPMYAGLAIAYLGGALLAGSWSPLILLPVVLVIVRLAVIGPEERYLTGHFGAAYTDYCARVRRWL
ncbi:MAG: isoprenylcysteine carboxylmethyltransferase family protein [Kofleriaceae bacterium]